MHQNFQNNVNLNFNSFNGIPNFDRNFNYNANFHPAMNNHPQMPYEQSIMYPNQSLKPNVNNPNSYNPYYDYDGDYMVPVHSQPMKEVFPHKYPINYPNLCTNNYNTNNYGPPFEMKDNMVNHNEKIEYPNTGVMNYYHMAPNFPVVNYNVNINSINFDSAIKEDPMMRTLPEIFASNHSYLPIDTLDLKPRRKMHANCTTLLYNRKTTNTSKNPRKFQCTYLNCFKAYMKSSHLKAHMRIHTGEKPHVCKFADKNNVICNKMFTRSDQLTRHRRKHTNDMPFHCLFCDKSFFRSDHCKAHQERCRRKSDNSNSQQNTQNLIH